MNTDLVQSSSMEEQETEAAKWWKTQRPNYVYVTMAAGILAFLAFATIWETYYPTKGETGDPVKVLGIILLIMLRHFLIWIPFLALEVWAYRFLPRLDQKINPTGIAERRTQLLIAACVIVCFLPLVLPAMIVMFN